MMMAVYGRLRVSRCQIDKNHTDPAVYISVDVLKSQCG